MIALNSKKMFFTLGSGLLVLFILIEGKTILIPIAVAILFAMILHPIAAKFESWGLSRLWSIIANFFATIILLLGVIFLFSTQLNALTGDFGGFINKLSNTADSLIQLINNNTPLQLETSVTDYVNKEWLIESGAPIISDTIKITGNFLSSAVLITIYSFLILLYRKGIYESLTTALSKKNRQDFAELLIDVKKVGQNYILGIGSLILLLSVLYSLALWLFGLDYPLLFGFLAAGLAIIPYIGTTIGASIPVAYAFYSSDSIWYPLGIMATFMTIQFIEGNFLTPKIVGGAMNLNALASIFALFLGYFIWGISGMILFLPMMAIFKIICDKIETLEPLGNLLSEDIR